MSENEYLTSTEIQHIINQKLTVGVPELHPIAVKSPWYHFGIDFVGPLTPLTNDGSQYILTLSDYFTKWVEAIPRADKTAIGVAEALFKVNFNLCMLYILYGPISVLW